MKKRLTSLLLAGVMAFGLMACGQSENSAAADKNEASGTAGTEAAANEGTAASGTGEGKDTFTYAIQSDTGNTLNYFTTDTREGMSFIKMINEPLFTLAADGSYNFYAAESFEPSEDGLTYTCKLKADTKWSDGEALTADDILFTFETYIAQDTSDAFVIDGTAVTINKVDDTTVEFVLPSAVASFPETVSDVTLLPKHIFEGKDSLDMNMTEDTIVGCGPYMFAEYVSGQYLKAVKNPYYVNGEANIETVIYQIITDNATAKAALQNGEVDAWVATASELDGLDEFTVTPYSEGRVAYVRLNRVSEKMQDADYRKGILTALNREEIMIAAYSALDYATVSYSFLPATNGYYTEDVEQYTQDIDVAKELVSGGATELKICYIGADSAQTAQAQVIQAQLKQIGIDVELCGLEQAAYVATAYDNEDTTYDMYLGGYIMTIDPDGYKGMFGTGQMINYASKELDDLFAAGMIETDSAKRAEIYTQAQQLVAEEALFYPFGTNLRIIVTNPSLKGIEEATLAPIYTFEDMSKLYFE